MFTAQDRTRQPIYHRNNILQRNASCYYAPLHFTYSIAIT